MSHPITVRTMDFGFSEHIDPVFVPEHPEESFVYLGISLVLPHLEPYLIRSMRAASRDIKDPELLEQVRRFCAQEGQHYRQHIRFNEATGAMDVDAIRALDQEIAACFQRYSDTGSVRFNLAYAEAFEAATTAVGLGAFVTGVFDGMTPEAADLWQWHLLEELEHRTVAFDVYEHLSGDYLYRLAVSLFVHLQLTRFSIRAAGAMLDADPDLVSRCGGVRAQRARARSFLGRLGRHTLPGVLRTYLPGYTPHAIDLPDKLLKLARQFSERAVRVS